MWYFTWILGVTLAVTLGLVNVLWLEHTENLDRLSDLQNADQDK